MELISILFLLLKASDNRKLHSSNYRRIKYETGGMIVGGKIGSARRKTSTTLSTTNFT
jgi:hypothetical protein